LDKDLAGFLGDLGTQLSGRSSGQLNAGMVSEIVARYRNGEDGFAEQLLQLVILNESLGQLLELAAE
jgi:asparagine synthase (glutamine-hydrolysing)